MLGLVAVGATLEGASLTLLIPILGVMSGAGGQAWPTRLAESLFASLGVHTATGRLGLMLGGFLILILLRGLTGRARDLTQARLQAAFIQRQRLDVTRALTLAQWSVVERLRHGRVTHAMSSDIMRVAAAANFMVQTVMAAVIVGVQTIMAFALSPLLTGVAIGFAFVGLVTLTAWLKRVFASGRVLVATHGQILDATTQYLGGMKLALSQNLQGAYYSRFAATLDDLRNHQVEIAERQANRRMATTLAGAAIAVLIVFVGLQLLHTPPLVLLGALALLARATGPAAQIQSSAQALAQSLPAYIDLRELCDELEAAPAAPLSLLASAPRRTEGRAASIATHGLGFVRDGAEILRGLDLDLRPGEFVGLAGASGAGKSTLADLLVGLLTPSSGEILVDGDRLAADRLAAWRDRLAYVSQDPFLFHDTVRANLAWGAAEGPDDARLWSALSLVGAEALVRGLPRGLDTMVGERGTLISGGERQRLALARALLRRPDFLILDEATNAIDIAGEALVLKALRDLTPRPTILLIAHRAESFVRCDRVLTLADGELRAPLETARAET